MLACSAAFDGTTRIFDSVTGTCLKVFSDHTKPVYAVTFSPDGRFLTCGGGDGWVYIYDMVVSANCHLSIKYSLILNGLDEGEGLVLALWHSKTRRVRNILAAKERQKSYSSST